MTSTQNPTQSGLGPGYVGSCGSLIKTAPYNWLPLSLSRERTGAEAAMTLPDCSSTAETETMWQWQGLTMYSLLH